MSERGGVPLIDFSPIGELGKTYGDAQDRATLANLGQGLADGTIDYKQAAGLAAKAGRFDIAMPLLEQHNSLQAGLALMKSLPGQQPTAGVPLNAIGGPPAPAPRAPSPMAMGQNGQPVLASDGGLMPPDAPPINAPRPGGPIPSSARVWGDDEAVKAGLYDDPAAARGTQVAQAPTATATDASGAPMVRTQPAAPAAGVAPPPATQASPQPAPARPATSPQLGGNMPGSGLTLIDSPALQGMPASMRAALPTMLASKQYQPQAMALIQKYINPEQWQLFRDTMGNVFTRNSATGESKPLIQATPQMMNANASGLPSPLAYEAATQMSGAAADNTKTTPEQKNAAASGGQTPQQYASNVEQDKKLADIWAKKYETSIEAGQTANAAIPQIQSVKNIIANDPNFFSGIGENYNLNLKKIGAAIGLSPDAPVAQEYVGKVLAGQITAGLKTTFGGAGLGPVRVVEFNQLKESLASKNNSPQALFALVTMAERTQQRAAAVAEIAQNYNGGSGRLDAGFDRQVAAYDRLHPILSGDEIANYRKIASIPSAATAAPSAPLPAGWSVKVR